MSKNNFDIVGLYEHNITSYKKIKKAFDEGEKVVGIVHATGTGKSYNALQLAFDNKNKKITYLVPSNAIMEHIKQIIENNPNLVFERDFPNLEFKTYQSLVNMSDDELEELDIDLLIIDEFHHLGAPIWGERIAKIIESHKNMKIFGMTAYTIRDRGTPYERDMANPETNELFSNKIVSRYSLADALLEGVLPTDFLYRSVYFNDESDGLIEQLEQRVDKLPEGSEKTRYKSLMLDYKRQITRANGIKELIVNNIKKDGKIIYFCPPGATQGINDVETIMKEVKEWFSGYVDEEDMIFYVTTSEMGNDGKLNRDAFYLDRTLDGQDASGKLRIMFAINQYNEGVHAPNVDGVIMGRYTTSDIVYFEQLGRALSVNKGTEDEKIVPVIIDLTNNFEFIKELEDELKGRIRKRREKGYGTSRYISKIDHIFDIKIENEDLYEMVKYLKERLTPASWEEMYQLAKNYYKHNNHLEIPSSFRTKNGIDFDMEGRNLGVWIRTQRDFEMQGILLPDRKQLLESIQMRFGNNKFDLIWQQMYKLAKSYYEEHGDLEVPKGFKTKDGIHYDEDGKNLRNWVRTQLAAFKDGTLTPERKTLLDNIGMRFENIADINWREMYRLATIYYEHHNDLEIPARFKTIDGYTHDDKGKGLGNWVKAQREAEKNNMLSQKRKELLEKIGIRFEIKDAETNWQEMYELAKNYYHQNQHLNISQTFKTINGIDYDENGKNLGTWIVTQRRYFQEGRLTTERKRLLDAIKMRFETFDFDENWLGNYNIAKAYYQYYGNLEVPSRFTTHDGVTESEDGFKLGRWIVNQRSDKHNGKLKEERERLLEEIGMRFELKRKRPKVKKLSK